MVCAKQRTETRNKPHIISAAVKRTQAFTVNYYYSYNNCIKLFLVFVVGRDFAVYISWRRIVESVSILDKIEEAQFDCVKKYVMEERIFVTDAN